MLMLRFVRYWCAGATRYFSGISLRSCCEVSGTENATRYFGRFKDKVFNPPETFFDDYATRRSMQLRAPYVMSGTDIAYGHPSPASAAADNKIRNQVVR